MPGCGGLFVVPSSLFLANEKDGTIGGTEQRKKSVAGAGDPPLCLESIITLVDCK